MSAPQQPGQPTWQPPWWVEPLIDVATQVGGAMYSNRQNRKAEERAAELQKEFAQHGIRWRVEDAKAAGLHPLYALGAQLPQFSPSFAMDSVGPALAEAGQSVGRALSAGMSPQERELRQLQLDLIRSQIGESDARKGLAESEAMRNRVEALQSIGIPLSDGSGASGPLGETLSSEGIGIIGQHINKAPNSFMPSEMDASVGANVNPLWSRFMLGNGREMVLPGGISGDAAEALESLAESPILMYMTFRENQRRYGKAFTDFLMKRYGPDVDFSGVGDVNLDAFKLFIREFMRGSAP